jgi:cation diffusion facilitator CzcD-associated flavoprotein CzcO
VTDLDHHVLERPVRNPDTEWRPALAELALPMRQSLDDEAIRRMKQTFPQRFGKRAETFVGFGYDVIPQNALDVSDQERQATYEDLWSRGGFFPWIGTYQDILSNEAANDTAYAFWRDKVRERIKDPAVADKLAPMKPIHPFCVKRPFLEQHYYEAYNQPNVHIVDLLESPIERVTSTSIKTKGREVELDVLVLATGFNFLTGGLTSIDICGTNGQTLGKKWSSGPRAHLGMASANFPNLLYIYGPQSPSAFCNGPTCAELQGDFVVACIEHVRRNNLHRIEATPKRRRPGATIHGIGQCDFVPTRAVLVHGRQHPRQEARDAGLPRRAAVVLAEVRGSRRRRLRRLRLELKLNFPAVGYTR